MVVRMTEFDPQNSILMLVVYVCVHINTNTAFTPA